MLKARPESSDEYEDVVVDEERSIEANLHFSVSKLAISSIILYCVTFE